MAVSSLFAFWAVAVLLIIVPGADWAFTIAAGVGGQSVLPAVGGLVVGYALVTTVVAAGVGALVADSPPAMTGLTLVGGAYLGWHGAMTLARPATVEDGPGGPAGRARDTLLRGIGVSGLNPKGLLLFLTLLPQFIDPRGSWSVAAQIGVLGATFTLTCAVFYLGIGTFARTVLHARPSAARAVSRLSGAAMIVVGVLIVVDRLARRQ